MLKKMLFGVVGLIVVVAAFNAAGGEDAVEAGSGDASSAGGSSQSASGGSETVGMGEPTTDGQFRFTVKKFDCGVESIGSSFMEEKAQGQFCIVTMRVKNTGDEARMLDASSQYLYDEKDRKFEASGEASGEASMSMEENNSFLEDINPGNGVVGKVVFDVPRKGFQPDHLELHDSMFSGGVTVSLRK